QGCVRGFWSSSPLSPRGEGLGVRGKALSLPLTPNRSRSTDDPIRRIPDISPLELPPWCARPASSILMFIGCRFVHVVLGERGEPLGSGCPPIDAAVPRGQGASPTCPGAVPRRRLL